MIISPERERTLRRVLDLDEDTGDARRGTKREDSIHTYPFIVVVR